jgi:hypothetical protein
MRNKQVRYGYPPVYLIEAFKFKKFEGFFFASEGDFELTSARVNSGKQPVSEPRVIQF